jgi:hypothetical protein
MALELLIKILQNIFDNKNVEKFKKINMNGKAF